MLINLNILKMKKKYRSSVSDLHMESEWQLGDEITASINSSTQKECCSFKPW